MWALPGRVCSSRIGAFGLLGRLCVLLLVLAGGALAAPVCTAAPSAPVAHAVLFYSPACSHCRDLIHNYLPPLLDQYGSRLQLLGVNAADPAGKKLFAAAVAKFDVPVRDRGVPAVVIGDRFLAGTVDVSEQLPVLVAQHLSHGGVGWPAVPGLSQALSARGALVTSSSSRLLAATEQPDGVLDRLARDRWGNTVALIVLAGMLAAVGSVTWRFSAIWRSLGAALPARSGRQAYAAAALTALGLCIASYLAYVETTHAVALCGPVGDCNVVQQSSYARLFGVLPVAYLGMAGYLSIGVALAIRRLASETAAQAAARALLLLTLSATLFSIYLTALEPFAIGATCAWCVSSAVVATLLLLLSAGGARRSDTAASPLSDAASAWPPRA